MGKLILVYEDKKIENLDEILDKLNLSNTDILKLYDTHNIGKLKELTYEVADKVRNSDRDTLVLTTSYFVLYSMGVIMLNSACTTRVDEIPFGDITAYEYVNDELSNITNEDKTLGENYPDKIMKGIMDDFYKVLNHYG